MMNARMRHRELERMSAATLARRRLARGAPATSCSTGTGAPSVGSRWKRHDALIAARA
jgi:hypothetical protein